MRRLRVLLGSVVVCAVVAGAPGWAQGAAWPAEGGAQVGTAGAQASPSGVQASPSGALASPAEAQASPGAAQGMPPTPPEDLAEDSGVVVRLSDVEGTVRLTDGSGKVFNQTGQLDQTSQPGQAGQAGQTGQPAQALVNMAMLPGMTLETGGDGRAELEFPDGSLARVTPSSSVALRVNTRGRLVLRAVSGLSYYEMKPFGAGYLVEVGPLTARNRVGEDTLLRVNLDGTPYLASVLRGEMHFEDASGNAAYELEANQTAKVDPGAASNYDIVLDVTPDTWDAWNGDRDQMRAEIAGAGHVGGEGSGAGWDELNYYGSWYDVPGQGMAWAPDGVDASFDPYGQGAWGYYSNVGYGWVSSYPWGWLPYHCGLWNYYQNYGWMWQPVGCGWGRGIRWHAYSGIGSTPYNYLRVARPQPPRGVGHRPVTPSVVAVNRGEPVRFREVGAPRPVARTLVVAGVAVQPVAAVPRVGYEPSVTASGVVGARVPVSGFVGRAGVVPRMSAPARMPAVAPAAAPRMSAPSAPPPSAPAMSAPSMGGSHMSAPSGGGGGHGH